MNSKMYFHKLIGNLLHVISVTGITFMGASCDEFVAIDPPKNQISGSTVFTNNSTVTSAISAIYIEMMSNSGFMSGGSSSLTVLAGISSDELINFQTNADYVGFSNNAILPKNSILKSQLWDTGYKYIFYANSILDGLNGSTGITPDLKKQVEGEAYFVRAFCNFYLVNLFGDIPVITTTDYRVNRIASRAPSNTVYDQIIADLQQAQTLLSNDYSFSGGKRIRPNRWAATALLARVYLYLQDWGKAEALSTEVISNTQVYTLKDINSVFLANSSEAIWQLMPVQSGFNTNEGAIFISSSTPQVAALTNDLLSAFEPNDNRKAAWVGSVTVGSNIFHFPYKYKVKAGSVITEYSMILRLAEQYLIRAESRAQQSKIDDAISDVDALRVRAGLPPIKQTNPGITKPDLLVAIEKERRIELFSEWGHRWLDLKRTARADEIMRLIKGSNWESTDVLYPIPQGERENNPSLSQNAGYN
ncbi:RagB/SusD family nutrient uptake outer membrane protein [Fulvivirgaceae bacterium PWU4]|uniref:RagB/SusD family nutrient uptake outer membrane protein n=1 Tax=Chryseosolibacter histidini TaxID=2782349 RepID=A0AAP2DTQ1_9BACT|nr:RagB/SusD family nutrient uptake outer membrane protein [Chryseosolibacter histidini]MBT1701042.1 RagB/SusD family nutrient uptake outer membrane protein [Chryseosolibacter histidini]